MVTATRRQALAAFGGSAAALALAGCGSALPEPDVGADTFGENASGTVRFWCRSGTLPATELVVERFNASQDQVRVVATAVPEAQFVTKLATAIRGRAVPDLVGIDDINSQLFIYRDAFTDLTPLLERLDFRDVLSPGHLSLAVADGRHHGLPYLGSLSRLFFNAELLERAGTDPDAPPSTLDEVLDTARAVSDLGPDTVGFAFAGNCAGCLGFTMLPHVWATDTDLIAGDVGEQYATVEGNEALPRALELYRSLWEENLHGPTNRTESGATWGADFVSGSVGMWPGSYGPVVLNATEDVLPSLGVTTLSGPDGGTSLFCGGDNFSIPRGAENAEGAWAFVRFALELEQQSSLPEAGYTPIRSDALTPGYAERYPLDVVALENLDRAYAPATLAYNRTFNQLDGPWFAMFQRAVYDGDVEGAIREGQAGFTRSLEQAQL